MVAVRRLVVGGRVGHTGTLDPFATGVLPLLLGRATRLSRYVTAGRKTYAATISLGETTDTFDRDGATTATGRVDHLTHTDIREAAGRFTGRILQTPPIFSARKISGRPMYELARRGEAPSPQPSWVVIHRLEIEDISMPLVRLVVETSAGTYVRSIAHDLGEALGCGAHLSELRRLASGSLSADQAHDLESITSASKDGRLEAMVLPMGRIDLGLPTVQVSRAGIEAMRNGRSLTADEVEGPWPEAGPSGDPSPVRIIDLHGNLLGVALDTRLPGLPPRLAPRMVLIT